MVFIRKAARHRLHLIAFSEWTRGDGAEKVVFSLRVVLALVAGEAFRQAAIN